MSDDEALRQYHEEIVTNNPTNADSVHFLAKWHMERHNYDHSRKYFGHLATLCHNDVEIWLCLCVCCVMAGDLAESEAALKRVIPIFETLFKKENPHIAVPKKAELKSNKIGKKNKIKNDLSAEYDLDIRLTFCRALILEKNPNIDDNDQALKLYTECLAKCILYEEIQKKNIMFDEEKNKLITVEIDNKEIETSPPRILGISEADKPLYMSEFKGEILIRLAVIYNNIGDMEASIRKCALAMNGNFSKCTRSNAYCLRGLIYEHQSEYPLAEAVYRSALELVSDHLIALERLGRLYLRFPDTIPAAVQCLFKAVELGPSNSVPWYLLGRCYMATNQYSDACEAYNRAINLDPNDPQIWCSLGTLYYAFGQYREALGMFTKTLKLDPCMVDAWYNIGTLYDMSNQPEDAKQAYMKAQEHGLLIDLGNGKAINENEERSRQEQQRETVSSSSSSASSSSSNAAVVTSSEPQKVDLTSEDANANAEGNKIVSDMDIETSIPGTATTTIAATDRS